MSTQSEKIRSINSVGWDGLNSNPQPFVNKNEQSDIDMQYALCFQTEAGRKVLEHLEKITIDQPAWIPSADPSYGYAREGQNSIVREIKARIRRTYG
jgi:hypothetical protein|tara:strand:+ start:507 stop:797 length:291 start_codon:yes stop_codon:yes gene_type:complete